MARREHSTIHGGGDGGHGDGGHGDGDDGATPHIP